ncbi:DUF2705 family protein [Heyndrickxia coagulans]|uniref:DUF2705 family protein n=1 Tax=Heyndrickxia coagulans TaxID=1398 RepID=UPI00036441D0|nr:DUF2705 family protein [Heyndrickxia coagulans]
MNKKIMFAYVIAMMTMQLFFSRDLNLSNTIFPFLDGVPIATFALEFKYLSTWYLPIFGLTMYYQGRLSNKLNGYGILQITRYNSKQVWLLKEYVLLFIELLVFIGCQCLINLIRVFWGQTNVTNGMGILLFSYFLMIYVIISLQSLLEMFLNSRMAFLIVNIYIVFSCISISEKGLPKYIYYLSLSNYGMGFKENLGKLNRLYTNDLNIQVSIFILVVLEVVVIIASALKVKKMDVI